MGEEIYGAIILAVFLSIIAVLIAAYLFSSKSYFRKYKRKKIKKGKFPKEWEAILKRNAALYNILPGDLKEKLKGHIKVFLAEKNFEGALGLTVTDEMRVTIAAQACLLILNLKENYYPRCDSVVIYPSAYTVDDSVEMGPATLHEKADMEGESWDRGTVVLAWDSVKSSAKDLRDGKNLVLHEFAHQLDVKDGLDVKEAIFERNSQYLEWARRLKKEYDKFRKNEKYDEKYLIDDYGATDEGEFFAVITETFFERPKEMKRHHPRLYEELSRYYRLDPAKW